MAAPIYRIEDVNRLTSRLLDVWAEGNVGPDEIVRFIQANPEVVLRAIGARPVRNWETGRDPIVAPNDPVWACTHDGPCLTSRGNWCDLGCGSDYNRMEKMQLWGVVI